MKEFMAACAATVAIFFYLYGAGSDYKIVETAADAPERSEARQFVYDAARKDRQNARSAIIEAAETCAKNNAHPLDDSSIDGFIAGIYARKLDVAIGEADDVQRDEVHEKEIYAEILSKNSSYSEPDSSRERMAIGSQVMHFEGLSNCVFMQAVKILSPTETSGQSN